MQRFLVGVAIVALIIALAAGGPARAEGELRALVLVTTNYGTNYYLIREFMEEYGWDITVTGITQVVTPCYGYGGPLGCQAMTVDVVLGNIADITQYDCLIIASATAYSGTSHFQLLNSQEALDLVSHAAEAGLVVAAWCGGVRVLAASETIFGKNVTGHPLYEDEYLAAGATYIEGTPPPVVDGTIITARRGQYYAPEAIEAITAIVDSVRAARMNQGKEANHAQ